MKHHPDLKVEYIVQPEMKGQSHALWLARQHLSGPMLMVFGYVDRDRFFIPHDRTTGRSGLGQAGAGSSRFGVAEIDAQDSVIHLVEKPLMKENNLRSSVVIISKQAENLLSAIEEQNEAA